MLDEHPGRTKRKAMQLQPLRKLPVGAKWKDAGIRADSPRQLYHKAGLDWTRPSSLWYGIVRCGARQHGGVGGWDKGPTWARAHLLLSQ